MKKGDGRGCLVVLIACIGNGKIVQRHGKECIAVKAVIVLEAVASEDTWIWHAFFGLPGTLNDINVLNRSP